MISKNKKHQYIVPFYGTPFNSLEDAKWNVKISFTRQEALRYFKGKDEAIYHFIGNHLHSETPIYVDNDGNIRFGKTSKLI